jgi:hypothetical protein
MTAQKTGEERKGKRQRAKEAQGADYERPSALTAEDRKVFYLDNRASVAQLGD